MSKQIIVSLHGGRLGKKKITSNLMVWFLCFSRCIPTKTAIHFYSIQNTHLSFFNNQKCFSSSHGNGCVIIMAIGLWYLAKIFEAWNRDRILFFQGSDQKQITSIELDNCKNNLEICFCNSKLLETISLFHYLAISTHY